MSAADDTLVYRVSEMERTVREVRDCQIVERTRIDALAKDHAITQRDVAELKTTLTGIEGEIQALRAEQKQSSKGTFAILRILVVLVPVVPILLHLIGAE